VVTVEDASRDLVRGMRAGVIRARSGHPYKPATVRGHESRLRLYVIPRIGAVALADLTRGAVKRLIEDLAAEVSPGVALNVRDALRVVLARQVDMEVVSVNAAAGVQAPAVDPPPPRFLDADEADRLQATADAHEIALIGPFVALALGTGARKGELQAIVWGAGGLDLDAHEVTITGTRDASGATVPTKSRRSRTVPLSAELVARMRRWRMAARSSADGARVFPTSHRRSWEQVRTAASLEGLKVHELRLSVHAVADLLGHSDAELVLRLYGHALPREVSSAGERLEAWRIAQRAAR